MDAIPMSPAAIEAATAAGQQVQTEGERAEETESGTTDEVIDIDVCEEATPAQVSSTTVEARVASPAPIPAPGSTAPPQRGGPGKRILQLSDKPVRSGTPECS